MKNTRKLKKGVTIYHPKYLGGMKVCEISHKHRWLVMYRQGDAIWRSFEAVEASWFLTMAEAVENEQNSLRQRIRSIGNIYKEETIS